MTGVEYVCRNGKVMLLGLLASYLLIVPAASAVFSWCLWQRGSLNRVGTIYYVFSVLGVISPIIDVFQTYFMLTQNRANLILLWLVANLPLGFYGVGFWSFVILHVGFSLVAFYFGRKGRYEQNSKMRTLSFFLGLTWTVFAIFNPIFSTYMVQPITINP